MGRKKKFIEKGEGVKFFLVHRSQKDPLYLDENLGEHVLMPADPDVNQDLINSINGLNLSNNNKTKTDKEDYKHKRLEEQQKFGIYYDDDYDYLQHLKEVDNEDVAEMDEAIKIGNVLIKNEFEHAPESKQKLNLPSSVFASKFEEDTGYFNQAAPDHDPKINWDPDIVRLLDEDADIYADADEFEDDFFVRANSEAPIKDKINNSVEQDDYDDEETGSDDSDGRFENDSETQSVKEFETKSRFSQYSMSSSVIKRNSQLKYLDEHFEKIYEQYDEEQIGGLDMEDIDGFRAASDLVLESALAEFEKNTTKIFYTSENTKRRKPKLGVVDEENESNGESQEDEEDSDEETETETDSDATEKADDDENDNKKEYEVVRFQRKKGKEDRLDCESIVSTYSTIYNRPAIISEPKKTYEIKLSKKTGLPLGILPDKPKSKKEMDRIDHKITRILPEIPERKPEETKEERKARKAEVKEHRRQRRVEKKINKLAFKEESKHQTTQLARKQEAARSVKLPL